MSSVLTSHIMPGAFCYGSLSNGQPRVCFFPRMGRNWSCVVTSHVAIKQPACIFGDKAVLRGGERDIRWLSFFLSEKNRRAHRPARSFNYAMEEPRSPLPRPAGALNLSCSPDTRPLLCVRRPANLCMRLPYSDGPALPVAELAERFQASVTVGRQQSKRSSGAATPSSQHRYCI